MYSTAYRPAIWLYLVCTYFFIIVHLYYYIYSYTYSYFLYCYTYSTYVILIYSYTSCTTCCYVTYYLAKVYILFSVHTHTVTFNQCSLSVCVVLGHLGDLGVLNSNQYHKHVIMSHMSYDWLLWHVCFYNFALVLLRLILLLIIRALAILWHFRSWQFDTCLISIIRDNDGDIAEICCSIILRQ